MQETAAAKKAETTIIHGKPKVAIAWFGPERPEPQKPSATKSISYNWRLTH